MVLKIGGSILADMAHLEAAVPKIVEYIMLFKQIPIIVVSAFKGETDRLSKMSQRFSSEPSSFVITVGEQITAGLFAQALEKYGRQFGSSSVNKHDENNLDKNLDKACAQENNLGSLYDVNLEGGFQTKLHNGFQNEKSDHSQNGPNLKHNLKFVLKSVPLAGWQVPIIADSKYEDKVFIDTTKLTHFLNEGIVSVVAGFQGVDINGQIKDLGRGGSDLTAVCIAKALKRTCVLLKKSGGICAADPDLVKEAFIWEEIGHDNLINLVKAGSRVVQTDAALVAKIHDVPIEVTGINFNTLTKIKKRNENFWSIFSYQHRLRIVAAKKNHAMFAAHGFNFNEQGEFYEFNKQLFDIKKEANKIYQVCKDCL